jgi:hypothetical protein
MLRRYDYFRSGVIFVIFQKSSKIGRFGFGPTCLSLTVMEIRLLPVWGNFSDFSSKIIKNRSFWLLSDVFVGCRCRYAITSGLVEFLGFFVKNHQKYVILFPYGVSIACRYRDTVLSVWGNFLIFRQKSSKIDHFSFVISGDLRVFTLLTQRLHAGY